VGSDPKIGNILTLWSGSDDQRPTERPKVLPRTKGKGYVEHYTIHFLCRKHEKFSAELGPLDNVMAAMFPIKVDESGSAEAIMDRYSVRSMEESMAARKESTAATGAADNQSAKKKSKPAANKGTSILIESEAIEDGDNGELGDMQGTEEVDEGYDQTFLEPEGKPDHF
jgi:hypothetical protein